MFDVHVAAAGEGKAKLYHSNSSILQELEQTASLPTQVAGGIFVLKDSYLP